MAYHVEVTDPAQVDAGEAYFWLTEQSPEMALRWYEGLLTAFKSLSASPLRCALAPENDFFEEEIRQLLYGKYRILFTIKGDVLLVLHVRHGAREYLKPEEPEKE
jgi:plasmid stabilization system protein ParE